MDSRLKKYRFFLWLILISINLQVFALTTKNDVAKEQIFLITDRDIYCVEESIQFKISTLGDFNKNNPDWSNIVYVELITPDGRVMVKQKLDFTGNIATGMMNISRKILSGNYYLQAYTKWMRNQSPNEFFYKRIEIANPFSSDMLSKVEVDEENVNFQIKEYNTSDYVSIGLNSDTVKVKSKVLLKIEASKTNNFKNKLSLSIVKKGSKSSNYCQPIPPSTLNNKIKYIPETRGVSLTGRVINQKDSVPVPYSNVWVTLFSEKTIVREVMSDSCGNFYIDLGRDFGIGNLYIQASSAKESVTPIVQVDNDFSYSILNLPFIPLDITNERRPIFEDIIITSQLENIFKGSEPSDSINILPHYFFYGKPDQTVVPSNFIELPTLNDYINEIIPIIKIINKGSKRRFQIKVKNTDLSEFEPLVMVNQIKIEDASKVLNISPKEIDRIELIKEPFTKGDITYGGIIHFITKSGKFDDLKLPNESIFLDYDLLVKPTKINRDNSVSGIPKIGNCLYWNPLLEVSPEKETIIEFDAGQEPACYDIFIEGFDNNSTPFLVKKSFVVVL